MNNDPLHKQSPEELCRSSVGKGGNKSRGWEQGCPSHIKPDQVYHHPQEQQKQRTTRRTRVVSAQKRRTRPQILSEPKAGGQRRWAREHPYISHTGLCHHSTPQQPQDCVFVQWRWSIFPKQSAHPKALTPDGLWRKAGDVRRSGAQQQPGLQTQPCPLLPQGCARGLGDEQDNTEIVQAGVIQKIFAGFGSLSNSEAGTASNIRRSPGSIHHHRGKAARAQLLKISTCKEKRGLHLSHLLRADPASDTHSNPLRGLRQLQGGGNTEKFRTCSGPNFRRYFSQFISGRSYLGPGCTRQLRALLFLTGHNMGCGFQPLGNHILVLTFQ